MRKTFFMPLLAFAMIFVLAACGPTANAPASGTGAPASGTGAPVSGTGAPTSGTDVSSAEPSQAPASDSSSTEPTPEPEPEPSIQDLPGAWTPVQDTAPDGWEICSKGVKHEIMESYDFYVGPDMPKHDRNVVSSCKAYGREMISYNNYVSTPLFYFMITPSDDVEKLYDRRLDHPLGEVEDYGTNWIFDREQYEEYIALYHIWVYDARVGEIHLMLPMFRMTEGEKLETFGRDSVIQRMENFVIVPTE